MKKYTNDKHTNEDTGHGIPMKSLPAWYDYSCKKLRPHVNSSCGRWCLADSFVSCLENHPAIFDFASNEFYLYPMPGGRHQQLRNTKGMLSFDGINSL